MRLSPADLPGKSWCQAPIPYPVDLIVRFINLP
jgi:hypothetical protein